MTKKKDPNARREAEKYAQPIQSREFILDLLEDIGRPVPQDELEQRLNLKSDDDQEALRRRLRAMVRDGQVVQNRRGGYGIARRMGVIAGRVQAHKDGFGFLIPDEGKDDIFLSPRQMASILHGDRVSVRISGEDNRGRLEGSVVDILERNTKRLVGRFFKESGVQYMVPDNSRFNHEVIIPEGKAGSAKPGQIVLVDILEYPTKKTQPVGEVYQVLGEHRAAGMEVEIAIHSFGLPSEFPEPVKAEAKTFGEEVAEKAKQGREDFRELDFVTIDGEDARDFDDAVFCEETAKGWRLIVAIADVAHYVQPGSPLDQEAETRGTSVYFPDWVIPMLPEELSNGLCSLNPDVDRLTMACEMLVDKDGKVGRAKFFNALIRSHKRLTYTQVGKLLDDGDPKMHQSLGRFVPRLQALHDLYKAFASARKRRGAIDFESVETKIVFDADRKIEDIVEVQRNVAHKIIEECMIAANVQAAKFLDKNGIPTLYRVHEKPPADALEKLRMFLGPLGLQLGGGDSPSAKDYSKLIANIQDRPDKSLIETVLLRSMSQAVYQPELNGHFGLGLDHYAHFTSPIRRYPDLLVHRGIKHILAGKPAHEFPYDNKRMENLGTHCSMVERRADDATRDAVSWLKCDYMKDRIGDEFDGLIIGVTSFGLFVEIKGMHVEGLVHVTTLENDYYQFDPTMHRLVGERGGLEFRLADPLRVRVARVDPDERKIDFEPIIDADEVRARRKARGSKPIAKPSGRDDRGGKKKGGAKGKKKDKQGDKKKSRRRRRK
ncbi:MAG: ribonuclease R [Gammaproteobacteria bacterium]|nr:ribonuclease R [Gammaproteobacteria bacterium]